MTAISFSVGMIVTLSAWVLVKVLQYIKLKHFDWRQETREIFFLINLLVIVRFTFYPFSKANGHVQPLLFDPATAFPFRVNLIPFVNLFDYDGSIRDILINIPGNIAMFIPTGVMLPLIYRKLDTMKKVVFTGFLMSLCIEIIQLPFSVRASDVDDLILNTLGCLLGYGIYVLFNNILLRHD